MQRSFSFVLAGTLVLTLTACGGDDESGPAGPTYYQDVKPILDAHCTDCHEAGGVAPFALDSYQDARVVAPAIVAATAEGTMPPWFADSSVEYRYDVSLSDEQKAVLAEWAEGGAAEGSAGNEGEPISLETPSLSRVDLELPMPVAYTQPVGVDDDYRCFVLDWPETEVKYITGFNAIPGNRAVVHHIAAYLMSPENPLGDGIFDLLQQWDAEDEGPGYGCFGGPSGTNSDSQIPVQQIAQWVPGTSGHDFPAGSGIEVLPGSKVVLQLHYNVVASGPMEDQTTVQLRLDDTVERKGAYAPWLDIGWPLGGMPIPAGEPNVVHNRLGDPRSFLTSFVGDLDLENGFTIHSALIHMHTLGVYGEVSLEKASGERQTVVRMPAYDFNWQREYQLMEPMEFEPGDKIFVECRFDNSPENQPMRDGEPAVPRDVTWGEGTLDEMCVGNLFITEK